MTKLACQFHDDGVRAVFLQRIVSENKWQDRKFVIIMSRKMLSKSAFRASRIFSQTILDVNLK